MAALPGTLGLVAVLALAACRKPGPVAPEPVGFDRLPGWGEDRAVEAVPALLRGCDRLAAMPADAPLGGTGIAARLAGTARQWRPLCAEARALPPGDDGAARAFFERRFQPYALGQGLLTGYYEPEVAGSRHRDPAHSVPLLRRPDDLVTADLGAFAPDLAGRRIAGRVVEGRLAPYWDRAAIVAGALDGRGLELAWLADAADAFFLQIQGSGRVRLAEGGMLRVGYAAGNGRPYVAIGKVLADRGDIPRGAVTMGSIRAWLAAHPDQAGPVMDANPSYVFFRELPSLAADEGPPGTLGAPLTPGRSVAVDREEIPLGAPLFLDTADPLDGAPLRRLVLAQDTGGAIRGRARADLFFGWGEAAEARAGRMQAQAQMFLLLPRSDPAPGG